MSWVRFDVFVMPGMECFELSHFQKMYLSVAFPVVVVAILALLRAGRKLSTKTAVQVRPTDGMVASGGPAS